MAGFTKIMWVQSRTVAVMLLAGLTRADPARIEAWIAAGSARRAGTIVWGTLAGLFAASLAAGQFGLLGLCVFWLGIILLIR
ncbi:MAG: hypothetical protein AAGF60_05315 [Pseudomonadota bacterium]